METRKLSRREAMNRAGLLVTTAFTGGFGQPEATAAEAVPQNQKTNFRFCLNTGTIRGQKLGLVKEIEVAAQAGYHGIEPWIEAIDAYAKGGGSLKDVNQRIRDLGITVESSIGFSQWLADDEAQRAKGLERAKYDMDLVAQIGGKRLAAPPAGATDKPMDLFKAAERYRALLELGDQMGVTPQLEVWGFSKNLHLLSECVLVAMESRHPRACVLADVFHLYKGNSDIGGLKLLSDSAVQIFHMNDYPSDPSRDKINDSYRVFPGDGTAPLTQILRNLQSAGGHTILSLELFNRKYWEQDALTVVRAGLEKMKAVVSQAAS